MAKTTPHPPRAINSFLTLDKMPSAIYSILPASILSARDKRGLKVSLPIIPSINPFEGRNRPRFEREREREKKEGNNVFIYRLPVYRSCRHEARYAENSTLFIGPSWFISRTRPSSSTARATSVGTVPAQLNSRCLASGKLSVYTGKTCETENVAPTWSEALLPTGNALNWIVRSLSLFFVGLHQAPLAKAEGRKKYLRISFNGNIRVNLLPDFGVTGVFIGNFTVVLRRKFVVIDIVGDRYCPDISWRILTQGV